MKVQASIFSHLFEPSSFIHTNPLNGKRNNWWGGVDCKNIGVEQSLTNIQVALREKGYEVKIVYIVL